MKCAKVSAIDFRLLYITTPNHEEALSIARTLLEEKLVACANILPGAVSLYWWDGSIGEAQETTLIAKTTLAKTGDAIERAKTLHSYDCPCIIALPIAEANPDFLRWIDESLTSAQKPIEP